MKKTFLLACLVLFILSCHKDYPRNQLCDHKGTVIDATVLNIPCEGLFIKDDAGSLFQPVGGTELLNGFHSGDRIRFGYEEMYLGMRSCANTVRLTCVEKR